MGRSLLASLSIHLRLISKPSSNASQPIDVDAGSVFPFEIYIENGTNSTSPHVFFNRQDKINSKIISASFTTGSTLQHVTCTRSKTGNMEIFINGIGTGTSGSDNLNTTQNNANLYIGNKGGKSNFLSGSLSNISLARFLASSRTFPSSAKLAKAKSGNPDCRVPRTCPGPLKRKSISEISKPSLELTRNSNLCFAKGL